MLGEDFDLEIPSAEQMEADVEQMGDTDSLMRFLRFHRVQPLDIPGSLSSDEVHKRSGCGSVVE